MEIRLSDEISVGCCKASNTPLGLDSKHISQHVTHQKYVTAIGLCRIRTQIHTLIELEKAGDHDSEKRKCESGRESFVATKVFSS